MQPDGVPILVAGAGIAGLAAARALIQAGFAVEVVERAPSAEQAGAGVFLPGNATRALLAFGVQDSVIDRGMAITRQRMCNRAGRLLTEIDLSQIWGEVGPCIGVSRGDLYDALRQGVSVTWGASVIAVDAGDGGVTVSLSDGTSRRVDLVLGADGVHSTLRRLLFGVEACPVGQVGWRFLARCPAETTAWTIQLGKGTTWLTIPIGSGRAYCYADQSADIAPDQPGDVEMLRTAFADFGEPARSILASLANETVVHTGVIEEIHLPQWHLGRVLLLGDAAHATSPNMAEGAAMALEDALVLAEVLTSSPTVDLALDEFERRRRGRTDWVRAQTHRRDHLRQLPGWVSALAIRTVGQRVARANYAPLLTRP